ncbi:MAG TPA: 4a-hydroxytetrahydrobiopterin dehydratase [Kineosporiaceae bacterium]|nr:4a-hydroxytetrahydrobiopterin dehydratase [Kineosporiaceae bacterium]
MSRLLDAEEISRQLADLPGVVAGVAGSLTVGLRAGSFLDAVRLIELVAHEAEELNHHPDLDLRWRTVTFTLSTHSAGGLTQLDVELAHRILAAAREVGADGLPAPERVEIALDCLDAAAVRPFWAAGLGYREQPDESGGVELHDPSGRGPVLWFQPLDAARPGRGRFHLDVYVPDGEAPARIAACLDAGGRLVTDEHAPSWWVLADPEGNELCICANPS